MIQLTLPVWHFDSIANPPYQQELDGPTHAPINIGSAVCPKCHSGISTPGGCGKCKRRDARRSGGVSNVTVGTRNVWPTRLANTPPNEWPVSQMVAFGCLSLTSLYISYRASLVRQIYVDLHVKYTPSHDRSKIPFWLWLVPSKSSRINNHYHGSSRTRASMLDWFLRNNRRITGYPEIK